MHNKIPKYFCNLKVSTGELGTELKAWWKKVKLYDCNCGQTGVQNVELQLNCYITELSSAHKVWFVGILKSSVPVLNMFHCTVVLAPMTEYSQVKESCKRNIKIFNKGFLSQYMLTCSSSLKIKFALCRISRLETGDIELNGCIHLCLVLS